MLRVWQICSLGIHRLSLCLYHHHRRPLSDTRRFYKVSQKSVIRCPHRIGSLVLSIIYFFNTLASLKGKDISRIIPGHKVKLIRTFYSLIFVQIHGKTYTKFNIHIDTSAFITLKFSTGSFTRRCPAHEHYSTLRSRSRSSSPLMWSVCDRDNEAGDGME